MKKLLKIFIVISFVLSISACTKRVETSSDLKDILQKEGYIVSDQTELIEDESINKVYIVTNNDYQFEYHLCKDEKVAKEKYKTNKIAIKELTNKNIKESNENNFDKLTQELSDTYTVLIRSKNIIFYSNNNIEYKKDLDKLLKKLGY